MYPSLNVLCMHVYVPVKRSLKETLLDILQTEDTYIDMDIQDYCEEEKCNFL